MQTAAREMPTFIRVNCNPKINVQPGSLKSTLRRGDSYSSEPEAG